MKKILIINVTANSGSTGRIAEEIGQKAIENGYECFFAYGRANNNSRFKTIHIGSAWDVKIHGIQTLLFDNHAFASSRATKNFVDEIIRLEPDLVHIHNIHGYYLNIEILLEYLAKSQIPVVCTLHDCWTFTGHCAHFEDIKCMKWKTLCFDCPKKKLYPKSLFIDGSKKNYLRKKQLFNNLTNLTIVAPSLWLADIVKCSFLSSYPIYIIHNGVNINEFQPCSIPSLKDKLGIDDSVKIILGVASVWTKNKGLDDFFKLASKIGNNVKILLAGLSDKQMKTLPKNVIGIKRTENVKELSTLYSMADVFVNPTYLDNFPTTNIESLACGTPVVTYKTGGSPEAINDETGFVVEQGNLDALKNAIDSVFANGKNFYRNNCRLRAVKLFNKDECFMKYIKIYNNLLNEDK